MVQGRSIQSFERLNQRALFKLLLVAVLENDPRAPNTPLVKMEPWSGSGARCAMTLERACTAHGQKNLSDLQGLA